MKGFTLIETVVSLAIFGLLVVMMAAVFISGLLIQRRAANIQQVQENASFLLETLTKELRTATMQTADTADCANNPTTALRFVNQEGENVTYQRSGTNLMKTVAGSSPLAVNADTIQFTNLGFCVFGQAANDGRQPRVTVFAAIKSTNADQQSAMDIQVTTSQRVLSF